MRKSAQIMERPFREVNGSRGPLLVLAIAMLAIGVVASSSCGASSHRADQLWHRALAEVEKGNVPRAVELLQKIVDDYPDAPIARQARGQLVVYRGLMNAVENYPRRRTRELMVQIARAVEAAKRAKGRVPETLDDAFAAGPGGVPHDPWGRRFLYRVEGTGYRLSCNGSDAAPGGSGDAADLVVVNGEFLAAP